MKHLLFTILFMVNISAFAQTNCGHFKIGTFKYSDDENITIIRTATTQTEINNAARTEVSGPIEWISDCEYVLTYEKVPYEEMEFLIGEKIYIKITNFDGEKYTCTATSQDIEFSMEITKITPQ